MPAWGDDICTGSLKVYPEMFCINAEENRYRIESLKSIFIYMSRSFRISGV